jgi:hypothetical protein
MDKYAINLKNALSGIKRIFFGIDLFLNSCVTIEVKLLSANNSPTFIHVLSFISKRTSLVC